MILRFVFNVIPKALLWVLRALIWVPVAIFNRLTNGFILPLFGLVSGGLTYAFLFSALILGAGFFLVDDVEQTLPEPKPISRFAATRTTVVYDPSGAESFRVANEYRLFEPIHTMPKILIAAFIAAEDQRFYEHKGVDGESFARAMFQNIRRVMQDKRALGGSTITQQVAKISMGNDRTFTRKLREALYATKLERSLSKDQIMEIYLNKIYFGVNTYGVGAAAERYFGKSVQQLNLSEVAYLAALPKGPVNYHPTRRTEAARARRNWVVSRMLELDMISRVEAEVATARELPQTLYYELRGAPRGHFNKEVNRELRARYGKNAVGEQGLKVVSTFEPETQKLTELVLSRHLLEMDALMGYRGPVGRVDMTDPAWDLRFLSMKNPSDFGNWQLALVLETRGHRAGIVLDNGRMGRLTLPDVKWARKYSNGEKINPLPWRVSDVVKVGDVILVEPSSGAIASPIFDDETPDLNERAQSLRARVDAMRDELSTAPRYRLRQNPELNGAAIVLDAKTSQVRAMSGGFSSSQSAFNRASQALRQPGSTVKPFVALAALESGYKPWSILNDKEMTLTLKGGEIWTPKNAGGGYWERVRLDRALVHSRNVPMVNLYYDVGRDKINDVLQKVDLYDEFIDTPSVVLGANETTLVRLASAYAAIANGGKFREATALASVHDSHDELLFTSNNEQIEECEQSVMCRANTQERIASTYAVNSLKKILREAMLKGTGKNVQKLVAEPVWGKTGTTNGARDAWFAGFTDDLVIAIYVGYDTPRSLGDKATGGRIAGPIFADLLNGLRRLETGDDPAATRIASFKPGRAFEMARRGRSWYFERSGGSEAAEPQENLAGSGSTRTPQRQPSALDTPSLDWGTTTARSSSGSSTGSSGAATSSVAIY